MPMYNPGFSWLLTKLYSETSHDEWDGKAHCSEQWQTAMYQAGK